MATQEEEAAFLDAVQSGPDQIKLEALEDINTQFISTILHSYREIGPGPGYLDTMLDSVRRQKLNDEATERVRRRLVLTDVKENQGLVFEYAGCNVMYIPHLKAYVNNKQIRPASESMFINSQTQYQIKDLTSVDMAFIRHGLQVRQEIKQLEASLQADCDGLKHLLVSASSIVSEITK
jgi:hypothetical protein